MKACLFFFMLAICCHADYEKAMSLYNDAIRIYLQGTSEDQAVDLYGQALKEDEKILQEVDFGLSKVYLEKLEKNASALDSAIAYLNFANVQKAREMLSLAVGDERIDLFRQAQERLAVLESASNTQYAPSENQNNGYVQPVYADYQTTQPQDSSGTETVQNTTSDSDQQNPEPVRQEAAVKKEEPEEQKPDPETEKQKEVVDKAKANYDKFFALQQVNPASDEWDNLVYFYKDQYDKEKSKLDKMGK